MWCYQGLWTNITGQVKPAILLRALYYIIQHYLTSAIRYILLYLPTSVLCCTVLCGSYIVSGPDINLAPCRQNKAQVSC